MEENRSFENIRSNILSKTQINEIHENFQKNLVEKLKKIIQKIKFDLRKWRKNNNLLYFKIILFMIRSVGRFLVMAACDGDAFASFER